MYFTIRGRVDSIEDTSYPRKNKEGEPQEMIARYSLTLSIPGMQDLVRCDLDPQRVENMPAIKVFDQWELDETWVVVTADALRLAKGNTDGRAWALASFHVVKVEELPAQERQALVDARRKVKAARKQKAADKRNAKQVKQPAA
jgi:hypothetical protein